MTLSPIASKQESDRLVWKMVEELRPCVSRQVINPVLNHVNCKILKEIGIDDAVDWSVCIACRYREVLNAKFVEDLENFPGKTP